MAWYVNRSKWFVSASSSVPRTSPELNPSSYPLLPDFVYPCVLLPHPARLSIRNILATTYADRSNISRDHHIFAPRILHFSPWYIPSPATLHISVVSLSVCGYNPTSSAPPVSRIPCIPQAACFPCPNPFEFAHTVFSSCTSVSTQCDTCIPVSHGLAICIRTYPPVCCFDRFTHCDYMSVFSFSVLSNSARPPATAGGFPSY